MTHWNFGNQRLFRSLDKAAQYAVDSDLGPEDLMVLEDGKNVPADRHDRKDLEMYMKEWAVL